MSNENLGNNFGKEVLLKDILNDTLFVNKTKQCFMIKNRKGSLFINDVQNNKITLSTTHSDDDKCAICTEDYTQFAYDCEVQRIKLLRSQDAPDVDFYAKHDIVAELPKGSCWFTTKATVYKVLDGVQYIINGTDEYGEYHDQNVVDTKECYEVITSNYHQQIKEVFDYLSAQDIGDIWVLVSGHTVYHQLFMGNSSGYLCSMWFGTKHPVKTVNCKIEWDHNKKYFDNFKSSLNVKVLKC